jgi:hypothetical protein
MTEVECVEFLASLRAEKIRIKSGWVTASCPLAKWLHTHHADSNPSFALSIVPGGRSYYTCFACQSGGAEALLHAVVLYAGASTTGYNFARCHQLLAGEELVQALPAYGSPVKKTAQFEEWPTYWLESFIRAEWVIDAVAYLTSRGVSLETVENHNLRYDAKRERIVCPYWDVYGRFAGARGRSIRTDATTTTLKHFDYSWQGRNNTKLVWYGEQALNLKGPVVVVEGQFDLFRTQSVFPKTVAALTAKPSWEKALKLGDSPLVIQIPDRDEAGLRSVEVYARYCASMGISHKVLWLDEGCKDPAECSPDYLREKIDALL